MRPESPRSVETQAFPTGFPLETTRRATVCRSLVSRAASRPLTIVACPRSAGGSTSRTFGITGCKSANVLLSAISTTTAMLNVEKLLLVLELLAPPSLLN
jgi:hypothetical protein